MLVLMMVLDLVPMLQMAIMLILKARCDWKLLNVEVSSNIFKGYQGPERRLGHTEPRFKLLSNVEQIPMPVGKRTRKKRKR